MKGDIFSCVWNMIVRCTRKKWRKLIMCKLFEISCSGNSLFLNNHIYGKFGNSVCSMSS